MWGTAGVEPPTGEKDTPIQPGPASPVDTTLVYGGSSSDGVGHVKVAPRVGALVGLSVGVLVGLAVLGAAAYFWWDRAETARVRKARVNVKVKRVKRVKQVKVVPLTEVVTDAVPVPVPAVDAQVPVVREVEPVVLHEAEAAERFEMDAVDRFEMGGDGAHVVAEDATEGAEAAGAALGVAGTETV